MNSAPAIRVSSVSYRYGSRRALTDVSLEIERGEVFALLGPNGGGKTTLFRLLSTLVPLQDGQIEILGTDVRRQPAELRGLIGVVFQAPSLDKKLTVAENLRHQGHLYGLLGQPLRTRTADMLARLGLSDRDRDLVETLSGGLRRRVELAKGMLHHPQVLLLDEPSGNLDPGARADLWNYLRAIRDQQGVTIVLTTHLLEEADKADRIAILHEGGLVALDTPDALRATVGGDSITIQAADPAGLAAEIAEQFHCQPRIVDGALRFEEPNGHRLMARLAEAFPGRIDAITVSKPSLEDVFIARTGRRFWQTADEAAPMTLTR
jgi:ABC-2 type transport system ATP-binding protein